MCGKCMLFGNLLFYSNLTRSSLKWQTSKCEAKKKQKKRIKWIKGEKSYKNCNRNSISGRRKAYLLCMSEQSKRLAGKMNLVDTFLLWNEARLARNGNGLCTSLISSAKRLKVYASATHTHTYAHAQLLYGKRFEYREKIKYIFTLDENKMRDNSRQS